jgi:hypothetical protein
MDLSLNGLHIDDTTTLSLNGLLFIRISYRCHAQTIV